MRNDRLKFRAWNPKTKTMMRVGEFPIYHEEDNGFHSGEPCEETGWTEFDIMQWTGLYDSEGREIYEGDLVQNADGDIRDVKHGYFFESVNMHEYSNHCYGWHVGEDDEYEDFQQIHAERKWRVVGNIHENPELIENG